MRRLPALALVVALASMLAGCSPRVPPGPGAAAEAGLGSPDRPQFTILYFNDLHGHLIPFTREGDTTRVGGAARIASLVKRLRQENRLRGRPTLLLEGGDIFQGTVLSSVFKGEPDIKFLNMLGLDAMVLGNHEFDFGLDVLRVRIREAKFPVLAANVRLKEDGLLTRPYVVQRLSNGVRVAIIGLVTDETPATTNPLNVAPLLFEPPLLTMSNYLTELESRADIVVALTHIGSDADKQLARAFHDVDVIVGGHDQVLIRRPLSQDDIIIAQAQEYGIYLGRLDLEVEGDGDEVELVADTVYMITDDIPEDPHVAELVASYTRRLDRHLSSVVGELAAPFHGERDDIRKKLTNFGLLLTTVMRDVTDADFAVINAGAVRASIDAGPVTLGEILQALPFANRVVTLQITGDQVRQLIERSLGEQKRSDSGGFLQVVGLTYDTGSNPPSLRVGDEDLDPTRVYTVAITDFLYEGGDGYEIFKRVGRNPKVTGLLLAQLLADHIRKNSPLTPPEPQGSANTSPPAEQ